MGIRHKLLSHSSRHDRRHRLDLGHTGRGHRRSAGGAVSRRNVSPQGFLPAGHAVFLVVCSGALRACGIRGFLGQARRNGPDRLKVEQWDQRLARRHAAVVLVAIVAVCALLARAGPQGTGSDPVCLGDPRPM